MLKIAGEEDAEQISALMKEVYERLEDRSLYVCDGIDYVKRHIRDEGFIVIAGTPDGKPVGSLLVRYPRLQEDNLGRDLGFSEEELPKVVHMESAVVLPEYRGNALQSRMLTYAEEQIDKRKYVHFLATVSPDNPASYKTFEKHGYRCRMTKEKYGGLMRRIYWKKVDRE